MKKIILVAIALCVSVGVTAYVGLSETSKNEACAKCVGAKYCKACKNCKYCKHCNSGGSCGVCRR